MQLFLDLLPVVAFFIAYKLTNIFVATAVLIVGGSRIVPIALP